MFSLGLPQFFRSRWILFCFSRAFPRIKHGSDVHGTCVTLSSSQEDLSWTLIIFSFDRNFGLSFDRRGGKLELAIVIVVLVVAGAMIPGNSKIRFFR
jgi:hypothetical protein